MQSEKQCINQTIREINYTEKSQIYVTVRIRPLNEQETQDNEIQCINVEPQYPNTIYLHQSMNSKLFTFDYIANEYTNQQELFTKVALPSADNYFQGYNTCILAYGQTGAGKTYSITGPQKIIDNIQENEHRGILPRVLDYLFQYIQNQLNNEENTDYLVKCSYIEIYNEHIIDLLNIQEKNLQIREDIKKGVYIDGLTEIQTLNRYTAINILKTGTKNRHVAFTQMNRESSRSHSVFCIHLQQTQHQKSGEYKKYSRFSFVDLAGSERTKQLNAQNIERIKEGCNINKSLSILGNVINSLVEQESGKNRHIHYRDSKLTFLLKDSLGGNSKTKLIANISPCQQAFQETLSTLKFAQRVKLIKNKVTINQDSIKNIEFMNQELMKLKIENIKFRETIQKNEIYNINQELNNNNIIIDDNILKVYQEINKKMQESEELCHYYLELAQENEQKSNVQLCQNQDQLLQHMQFAKMFQQNELQYRQIIKLQQYRIDKIEKLLKTSQGGNDQNLLNDLKVLNNEELQKYRNLLDNQYYYGKLLKDNIFLKQKLNKNIRGQFHSLNTSFQNIEKNKENLVNKLTNNMEFNIEQRVKMQQTINEIEEKQENEKKYKENLQKIQEQLQQSQQEILFLKNQIQQLNIVQNVLKKRKKKNFFQKIRFQQKKMKTYKMKIQVFQIKHN
ncbi:kinesin motor domain protein [Ichthyophthirius multifiliis]|uniref:Kinesin-like protein n=1 Tax=Ichthyophthirius multifiliis TaxID=5932 RepID=G0R3B7_ICHMU|nr:kinesin motor domain protein [Ichthyophthirius multifiliis]EGR28036.1 kinesin motor domain protein [Ichthyophthirius multifiliis]|eukprot:XP_004027381.1 kinesin motor domain protein [Ichthyophthirius multifiliis]